MTEAAMKESSPLVGSSQNSSGGFVNTFTKRRHFIQIAENGDREKKNSQKFVNSKNPYLSSTTQLD
jgi:hypothetical protein